MSDKTEKAALERRIDELCAELGHAQLNRDMWHDRAEDMRNRLSAVQAENDKLRELCGEMLLYIAYPYVCVRPSVLIERARELGVEVDG